MDFHAQQGRYSEGSCLLNSAFAIFLLYSKSSLLKFLVVSFLPITKWIAPAQSELCVVSEASIKKQWANDLHFICCLIFRNSKGSVAQCEWSADKPIFHISWSNPDFLHRSTAQKFIQVLYKKRLFKVYAKILCFLIQIICCYLQSHCKSWIKDTTNN